MKKYYLVSYFGDGSYGHFDYIGEYPVYEEINKIIKRRHGLARDIVILSITKMTAKEYKIFFSQSTNE